MNDNVVRKYGDNITHCALQCYWFLCKKVGNGDTCAMVGEHALPTKNGS